MTKKEIKDRLAEKGFIDISCACYLITTYKMDYKNNCKEKVIKIGVSNDIYNRLVSYGNETELIDIVKCNNYSYAEFFENIGYGVLKWNGYKKFIEGAEYFYYNIHIEQFKNKFFKEIYKTIKKGCEIK